MSIKQGEIPGNSHTPVPLVIETRELWYWHGLHAFVIVDTVPEDTGGARTEAVVAVAENDGKRAWSRTTLH